MATSVDELLVLHPSLTHVNTSSDAGTQIGRLQCSLSGHEMPATVAAITSYVSGRKYKRAFDKSINDVLENYPQIVTNTKNPSKLFCKLTLRGIERSRVAIDRHVTGKRFKSALRRWKQSEEEGVPFKPTGANRSRRAKFDDVEMEEEGSSAPVGLTDSDLEDFYPGMGSESEASGEEQSTNPIAPAVDEQTPVDSATNDFQNDDDDDVDMTSRELGSNSASAKRISSADEPSQIPSKRRKKRK